MKKVTKAIFPVAGLGTRFLPATKANPKEMLPIVDKPLIQYAVEEAINAGITELVFVTGRTKRSTENILTSTQELRKVIVQILPCSLISQDLYQMMILSFSLVL